MSYKSPLKYNPYLYSFYGQRELSDKEKRREYSRLRSIANKRLKRIGETVFRNSQTYLNYSRKGFPSLKNLDRRGDFQAAFNRVGSFLRDDTTLRGLRNEMKRRLAVLHSHGYDFVTEENQWDFYDFMHYAEEQLKDLYYDSDKLVENFTKEIQSKNPDLERIKQKLSDYIRKRDKEGPEEAIKGFKEFDGLILNQTPQDINKLRRRSQT